MFSISYLLTIYSYFLYDAADGSRNLTTGKLDLDHSGKEHILSFSTSITSPKFSFAGSKDDYGWIIYTTIRPQFFPNPNDNVNKGNNNTIQFFRRATSIYGRNILRIGRSGSYETASQFAPERLRNDPHSKERTHDVINMNNGSSHTLKIIPSENNSDSLPIRDDFRMNKSSPLSINTPSSPLSINRANRTNHHIRRISSVYESIAMPRRSYSRTHSPTTRYTSDRLEPFKNLEKHINVSIGANSRTNQFILKNTPLLSSNNSSRHEQISRNILEKKGESDNRKSSISPKRCILSPGDMKRKCLKKIKRKKLKTRLRSNAILGKVSTSFPVERKGNLHDTDPIHSKGGLNERLKLGEEFNNNFNQTEYYPRNGKEDSSSLNQYASSDIPCSCHWNSEICGCDCEGSFNYDNFMNLSRLFRPCQNFTFTMRDGHFYALPPNLFHNVNSVDNFHIYLTNSSFEYLLDPTPMTSAFSGVHFRQHAFVKLNKVSVRRGWNWSSFQKLQGAPDASVHFIVEDSTLKRLTSDFSNFANGQVEIIDVAASNLEMIGSAALGTFVNMTNFRVPNNKISNFHRMDFPKMCSKLEEIDLRNNQLNNLEGGLFDAMPSLKEVKLSGNPLSMLSEKTFQGIITRVNLLGISGFPLFCDCHLKWLKDSKISDNAIIRENLDGATCRRPGHLRGTPFNSLSKEHLVC